MKRVVTSVAFLLLVVSPAFRSAGAQGSSALGGVVRDLHGTPQMGALIELLGPDAAVVAQTYTDDHGRYLLNSLSPGRYQLRASAAFALPSLRGNLHLTPGVRFMADLTMTAMIDVGAWFPAQRRGVQEPSDDWRWTLRSAANRPLLRLDDEETQEGSGEQNTQHSSTQAQYTVVSGDGSFAAGGTRQVFTLAHEDGDSGSEIVRARVGDVSFPNQAKSLDVEAGVDRHLAAGGETRVVAGFSSHPELSGPGGGGLQAFTFATSEHMALGDTVMIDAGTLLSAERLIASRVSSAPFLKVVVAPLDSWAFMYRYATERAVQGSEDLADAPILPDTLSDAAGRPLGFGNRHQEISASHQLEADTETLTLYQDDLADVPVQGIGALSSEEIVGLPVIADVSTSTLRIRADAYRARGLSASWTHQFAPLLSGTVLADVGSTLQRGLEPLTLVSIAQNLSVHMRPAFAASVTGKVERTGTAYWTQYRWQPANTLSPVDAYNTGLEQGFLSCSLRQKLWSGKRLHGLDAVIEATNLLEEGYQPVIAPDGETIFLAQAPRAMQAGLSFKF